jgi:hypothetical protein
VHASGKKYEWASDPEATPIPHLPLSALLYIFRPKGRPSTGFAPSISLADLVSRVSGAQQGTRNHELNATSFLAGKLVRAGKVSPEEAEFTLVQAALSIGLDRHESIATVRSGLRAGQEA